MTSLGKVVDNVPMQLEGEDVVIGFNHKYMADALKAAGATDFSVDYKFTDIQGAFNYEFSEDKSLQVSVYIGKRRRYLFG